MRNLLLMAVLVFASLAFTKADDWNSTASIEYIDHNGDKWTATLQSVKAKFLGHELKLRRRPAPVPPNRPGRNLQEEITDEICYINPIGRGVWTATIDVTSGAFGVLGRKDFKFEFQNKQEDGNPKHEDIVFRRWDGSLWIAKIPNIASNTNTPKFLIKRFK